MIDFDPLQSKDPLTREICIRILEYLGVLPCHNFGQVGISLLTHQLSKNNWIMAEYEGNDSVYHPIYVAKLEFKEGNLRLLLTDLSFVESVCSVCVEFYLLFKLDNLPIHYLHYSQDGQKIQAEIRMYYEEKKIWLLSNLQSQVSNLIGFNTLFSLGSLWSPQGDYEDLRQAVLDLLADDADLK